ncbi:hypothetical protein V5799_012015 [Amblyomma americanum]|uniref:Monocarboxylate transporter n=1 Tax=Amblyomma americanum TaxID=6943 RepID=A0AAQ4EFJ6_AMBAM
MTVLDYALEKGTPRNEAEPIITYVAAAEIFGPLTVPFLWDRATLALCTLVALCLTVTATSLAAMPHTSSFAYVGMSAVTTGLSCGCVVTLKPVLLSDHFGVHMLSLCWGMSGIAMLPLSFGGPLLLGVFRDTMGSYDNLYSMLPGLCIIFAGTLFAFAFYERRTRRRREEVQNLHCH